MNRSPNQRKDLDALSTSLESLREDLQRDVSSATALTTVLQRLHRVQSEWRDHRATSQLLRERIAALLEVIECRMRTLAWLRARMRQIRGGAKPH